MYRKSTDELLEKFHSNRETGLSQEQVINSRGEFGENKLQSKKRQSIFVKFLLQFKDILLIILIIAAIVSLCIDPKEWFESAIIFFVVIVNAILGVFQEDKAEKSLDALKKMSSPTCKVRRDGLVQELSTDQLVAGDIILVEAGDYIPADARLFECSNLQVEESALTGESLAVTKNVAILEGENLPLGDRKNMLFSSTFVTNGHGEAIVTAVGMQTEIGKIAGMLLEKDDSQTPLQIKLAQVGKAIGLIAIIICAVVFVMEKFNGLSWLDAFKTAVALAVAAIPEGLATVVTISLAIGVQKMSKQNAIVKKLPAVETLGCTSIVCSDKTGTLTQNKMTCTELFDGEQLPLANGMTLDEKKVQLLQYFALCCDAKIDIVDGVEKRLGDPTETALIEINNKLGKAFGDIKRVGDLPFDSERKLMTVVLQVGKKFISVTKGAPDNMFKLSVPSPFIEQATNANTNMAERALRVLGLGIKEFDTMPVVDETLEKDMTFLGLIGMIDPSRPEVKVAIEEAKKAGIRPIMITGDHITTATAIARELGIFREGDRAITSEQLEKMSDKELDAHIEEFSVYARVAPKDKVRIVEAWQKKDMVVAMTGDGVNDSPALKKADIGCAMGITGTDVSKEAADMILVDDNFATIINAVEQGRGIYANVKKCVRYLLSSNFGEVLTIFVASIISMFMTDALWGVPLLPIHLLWINLITDSLPAFGLGMDSATKNIMLEAPRPKKEGFFANGMIYKILFEGIIFGALSITAFTIGTVLEGSLAIGQTMTFLTLSTIQLFHSFNVKSDRTLFCKETFNNKFLNMSFLAGFALQILVIYIPGVNTMFKLAPLSIANLATCIGLAAVVIVFVEIFKLIANVAAKKKQAQIVIK
ncbi:MAG: cation-translocating P-type ATPase [Clostridia bacterium]